MKIIHSMCHHSSVIQCIYFLFLFLQAVERGDVDCPICLTSLIKKTYIDKPDRSSDKPGNQTKFTKNNSNPSNKPKSSTVKNAITSQTSKQNQEKEDQSMSGDKGQRSCRQTVLLSCSHVFHATCLKMFEELSMETNNSCPVCRTKYQKKILTT